MKRLTKLLCMLLVLVLSAGLVPSRATAETVVGNPDERINAGRIEYGGQSYRRKKRVSTVLLMGVDKSAEETGHAALSSYRNAGQADFLMLIVIDDNAEQITPLVINRDTMTEITTLSAFGQEMGQWNAQICLSFGFGDGQELSCELTCRAVEGYLTDIEIDDHMAVYLEGIRVFNDAIGGVTVTLTEDFTAYDPGMVKGATITLTGDQAEYYTRMRYYVGDQSNASRIVRQETYLRKASEVLREKLREDQRLAETVYEQMLPYIVTNMPKGRLINYANLVSRYEVKAAVEIAGENVVGPTGFVEFYPDADALQQVLIELFYEPI